MTRTLYQAQDINSHRADYELDIRKRSTCRPDQRYSSVLKLLHLRHEKGERIEQDVYLKDDVQDVATTLLECNKSKRAADHQKSIMAERNLRFIPKESIKGLRLKDDGDSARSKSLDRDFPRWYPYEKQKQFFQHDVECFSRAKSHSATNTTPIDEPQLKLDDIVNETVMSTDKSYEFDSQADEVNLEKVLPMTPKDKLFNEVANILLTDVGIQCQLATNDSVRRNQGVSPSIVDKFPIWVDVDDTEDVGAEQQSKQRKKFLQVTRFTDSKIAEHVTDNEAQLNASLRLSSTTPVSTNVSSEKRSNESLSGGHRFPYASERTMLNVPDNTKARYRASYKEHYPVRERTSSKKMGDQNEIDLLLDLQDNMKLMTERLQVLEDCANSIDEEFKVTQMSLSRRETTKANDVSLGTGVLNEIDQVLEATGSDTEPRVGLLSKKASSDLDAAKKLLETIEQLMTSTSNQ